MKKTKLGFPLLILSLVGLLSSCTYGTAGIFYALENEEKVYAANGINSNVTVFSMAELGTNLMIACGPKFYYRPASTTTWHSFNLGGQDYAYAVAEGKAADTLWAVAGPTTTGNTNYLYYTGITSGDLSNNSNWHQYTASSFSGTPTNLIPILDTTGKTVVGHTVAGGGCFLVTNNSNDYSTIYLLKGSGDTPVAIALNNIGGIASSLTTTSGINQPITSAAYDGTSYYVANRSYVWKITGSTAQLLVTASYSYSSGFGNDFGSICYVGSGNQGTSGLAAGLYVGGVASASTITTSYIYQYDTTATNSMLQNISTSLYSTAINATTMSMGSGALLVGGRGVGYGELTSGLTFNKPTSISTDTSNYYSTVLYSCTITMMYYSYNENQLFLSASGNGIWSRNAATMKWSLQ